MCLWTLDFVSFLICRKYNFQSLTLLNHVENLVGHTFPAILNFMVEILREALLFNFAITLNDHRISSDLNIVYT